MKTIFLNSKNISLYSILGLFAFVVSSCGSYQNSSYYDNDGIYGSNSQNQNQTQRYQSNSSGKYQEYFSSLNNQQNQVFTDVDKYSSYNDTINKNNTSAPHAILFKSCFTGNIFKLKIAFI